MIPLLDVLKKHFSDTSLNTLKQWIKYKRVIIDGKPAEDIKMFVSKYAKLKLLHKNEPLENDVQILYQDSHLVVVEKPDKLLSVATENKKHSIHQILKLKFHPKKVSVIHRLDEGTSGVMLFSFSDPAYKGLKEQFKDHSIERVYIGLVEGVFPHKSGTWESYLYEDEAMKVRITKDTVKGERAVTHYEKISAGEDYTLMRFKLETGKKNQIRVQAAAAGFPIAGDRKYGSQSDPIHRLALHAETLGFIHPITKKEMHFVSKPPKKFSSRAKKDVNPKSNPD